MRLTRYIVKKYSWAVTFSKVIKRELVTLTPMPLSARLKMWWNGFFSAAWFRYEFYLKENKPDDYVSDYEENLRASKLVDSKYTIYVDNKIVFPVFFGTFAPVVFNYAFINNARVIAQDKSLGINSFDDIIGLIKKGNKIVIKPADGQRGGNVHKLFLSEENKIIWNNRETNEEELLDRLPKLDFNIICPWVEQSEYVKKIYPSTTNTVRILTCIDPESNEAFIAHAVQRIGTKHSFPVDNFAVGGLTCAIDIDSGVIQKGSYIIPTESKKTWYDRHPETNEQIEGIAIPNWQKVKKRLVEIASSVSFLKVIGWDLIIQDNHQDGFVLLEGNNAPCYKVHQLHGGLLKDPRVAKFMKYHKIAR